MQKPALYKTRVATVFGAGRHWLDCIRAGTYARAIGGPVAMTTAAQDKRELLRQWRRENCEPLFVRSPGGWQSRAKTPRAAPLAHMSSSPDSTRRQWDWGGGSGGAGRCYKIELPASLCRKGDRVAAASGLGRRESVAEPVTYVRQSGLHCPVLYGLCSVKNPCIRHKVSEIPFLFHHFRHKLCIQIVAETLRGQAMVKRRASDGHLMRHSRVGCRQHPYSTR